MNPNDRERVLVEVVQRVLDRTTTTPEATERALFDTLFDERQRLEQERDRKKAAAQRAFYEAIQSKALKADPTGQRELLREILRFFADEVAGHFDPRVYQLATRAVPVFLNLLLNTLSPLRLLEELPNGLSRLDEQLEIQGERDALQRVARSGTVVMVPTHSSNLDSILIGFMLHQLGLPPFTYGAGLNLFANKLIGFFMHNLGAYKVDRRKKAAIYKDVLKTYAGYSMELGYHNLFFPGGTRARSGKLEQKLKLGLLGMGLDAYVHNLQTGKEQPDLFVVPVTINYQLVLEAETLIDDHLQEVGKSRYIIEDDEFSKPKRILDFISKLFSLQSRIHLVVSAPLDLFGNRIDENNRSLDPRGREVDRRQYVLRADKPDFDPQRDMEYTRELGQSIAAAFRRDTVIKSVNLVSRTIFDWLKERNPQTDLYRLLRTGGIEESLPLTDAYRRLDKSLGLLRKAERAGRIRLDESLKFNDTVAIVADALTHLNTYHRRPALTRRGDRLFHEDRNLLLYYQNRLEGLDVQLPEVRA